MKSTPSSASKKRAASEINSNNNGAKRKTKRESFMQLLGTEIVDIYVGNDSSKKHFQIHKAILCSKLPFFDSMFNSGFKEGINNSANLPEDDPDAFDVLLEWIYTGSLPKFRWVKQPGQPAVGNYRHTCLLTLVDKLCLDELKDQIASDIIDASVEENSLPSFHHLSYMINHLSETSAFREYYVLALLFIVHGLPRTDENLALWPTEGFSELLAGHANVATAYFKAVRSLPIGSVAEDPRKMPRCKFHEHGQDEECSVGKKS
ncbi:hypothetical protein ONS95_007433 [Cadophora gregata]|uniref:uncharacterized protein n=1 Tax=Cadophora gregata TaxID=51156 RepID=UPI0026DD5C27|nr:uncharacterized protein ONS95_007433 [Cadophora gregata]KAK0118545.1 hypothetical protein ONS96_011639 [Cadophora gregata f. sp. sojae]KAK0125801.1 hypothetical protein ONS95_007433 [Cadophora gregata]